jgi:hypothetical protein
VKLEELRALLETPAVSAPEGQAGDAETCACCAKPCLLNQRREHPVHGSVCLWCRAQCYDVLADEFHHVFTLAEFSAELLKMDEPDCTALQNSSICKRCGNFKPPTKTRGARGTFIFVSCTKCSA